LLKFLDESTPEVLELEIPRPELDHLLGHELIRKEGID
jgi:hypothetical protein